MTPKQYNTWRKQMGFTHVEAAKALGVSERTSYNYASGNRSINKCTEMVCKMLLADRS